MGHLNFGLENGSLMATNVVDVVVVVVLLGTSCYQFQFPKTFPFLNQLQLNFGYRLVTIYSRFSYRVRF